MRCPKCGYNSFDHNLLCPKCRKDLTATRRLLNLTVPAPGATDFFNTAGQRAAFPEPLLGNELMPDNQPGLGVPAMGAMAAGALGAGAMAASSPFGAPPFPADQPFGAPPFPVEQPFGTPPFPADATLDDIVPLDADDDLDEIVPIEVAAPVTPITVAPVVGEEEIEIEIDDLVEPDDVAVAPVAPVTAPPVAPESHQTALNHIKDTLAATGDLSAPTPVLPDIDVAGGTHFASPAPGGLPDLDLDEPLLEDIGDIDDSDILEPDDIEENAGPLSDTVAVDLDPEDLAPDFFDEVAPEPEPAPAQVQASAPELEPIPNLEDLSQGDLAGPFWEEEAPAQVLEADQTSLEGLDEAAALGELDLDQMDDPGIEPEDLALGLETDLGGPDQELTAAEMFAEEIQAPEAPPAAAAPPVEESEKRVHPAAVPEIPAGVFDSIPPESTLPSPKTAPGSLEADDLSSLADDINLDDLDSEL